MDLYVQNETKIDLLAIRIFNAFQYNNINPDNFGADFL